MQITQPLRKSLGTSTQFRFIGLWLLVGIIGLFVLFPVYVVVQSGVDVNPELATTHYGLSNYTRLFDGPLFKEAIWNTLRIFFVREAIALVVATFIAWAITRTNVPGASWLEFGVWVSFFLPSLAVIQGWVLLAEGQIGVLNRFVALLPFVDQGPFEIFSFWGIIWTHLMANNISAIVILLALNFRRMDSSLEEAGRVSGASALGTLARIMLPLQRPIYALILVVGFLRALQSFEIEWILGGPPDIQILGTLLVTFITDDEPDFGAAGSLATLIILLLIPLLVLRSWFVGKRSYVTVSGRATFRPTDLRRWRWPVFGFVIFLLALWTLVPFGSLLVGTFMNKWGWFQLGWTLDNWATVLTQDQFMDALVNTLLLGFLGATIAVGVLLLVAYVLVRVPFRGQALLDYLTWLPWAIPGLLLSLGILSMVLEVPFLRFFHGTLATLIFAIVLFRLPLGSQLMKTGIMQVGAELEEAGRVSGARFWRVQRLIIVPLLARTMLVIWLLTFMGAVSEVSGVILLAGPGTQTLSLLAINLLVDGQREAAAVITTVVLVIAVGLAFLGRRFGLFQGQQS